MALALYRKYRPRSFAEIIGQEHVTEPLSQALRSGRLHHAYLFSGPRGCGKTSSARILARSLNCERGPTPEPCGECESCRALAPDGSGSIDVIEIDAASHGGVDDARELRERAFFAPVASRFKVYVIDEAHMVSSAGFNALLKLVEEPPDYVKFVFATTEPEKVLGTIKSRTHHYPFRLIPPGILRPYLEQLATTEGVKVEPAVFPLVVRAGGGSARDSLSVLDQLIAGAGDEGVSYARAVALLGVTDVALIDEMCDALAANDGAGAYGVIDRVVEAGHDPRRFAADLLERLRDLIVLQQVPDAAAKGLLDCPEDQLDRMSTQAAHLGAATLSRFADIVHNGLTEMRGATAPRLLLELICARMLLPGATDSDGALLQRLERMERRLAASADVSLVRAEPAPAAAHRAAEATAAPATPAPVAPAPTRPAAPTESPQPQPSPAHAPAPTHALAPTHAPAPAHDAPAPSPAAQLAAPAPVPPPSAATTHPGALDAVAVRRVWDEVLAIVSGKSKTAAALVREGTVRDIDGDTLVLLFKHSVHATMLANRPEMLIEALYELLGVRWKLRCELGAPAGGQPTGPAAGGNVPRLPGPSARPTSGSAAREATPASTTVSGSSGAQARDAVEDWPTPARPGGIAAQQSPPHQEPAHQEMPRQEMPRQEPPHPEPPRQETPHQAPSPEAPSPQAPPLQAPPLEAGRGHAVAQPDPSEDWPTPAQPGANTVTANTTAANTANTAGAAVHGYGSASTRKSGSAPSPRRSSGAQQARAAASRAGSGQRAATATRKGAESGWEGAADEPPYDPDYDGPVRDPQYPGFDPGDEPLDDAESANTHESTEEAALRLLSEALGAEKITETGA